MAKRLTFIILIITILLAVISIVFADQYVLLCLQEGEKLEYSKCNPRMDDRTCGSDMGCSYCVIQKDSGVYCPGNPNACNSLGLGCSYLNNATLDAEPPILTVDSPVQDEVYRFRNVPVNLSLNEMADVHYYDNLDDRGRWSRLCSDCTSYARGLNFDEGFNSITIRATDPVGNSVNETRGFFVNSQRPKVQATWPKRNDYTNGYFYVKYKEENPLAVSLTYGWNESFYTISVPGCLPGRNMNCNISNVDLSEFDGGKIKYYFTLDDGVFVAESKNVTSNVDITPPELSVNVPADGGLYPRKLLFNISITEKVESLEYSDNGGEFVNLCRNCNKYSRTRYFALGDHTLRIVATDHAGNTDEAIKSFTTA